MPGLMNSHFSARILGDAWAIIILFSRQSETEIELKSVTFLSRIYLYIHKESSFLGYARARARPTHKIPAKCFINEPRRAGSLDDAFK